MLLIFIFLTLHICFESYKCILFLQRMHVNNSLSILVFLFFIGLFDIIYK